ncbi:MAG: fliG [Rhodospirillaceae bacterium]|nr:MAG: fliG [Rhodospirillaceae bacterium]
MKEDYCSLASPEKMWILVLSLRDEYFSKLFAMVGDEEIKELSQIMAGLGAISSSVVEHLFVEFVDQISSTGSLVGSRESTERLLSKSPPKERVEAVMEEIRGPAGRTMWDKLSNVNE